MKHFYPVTALFAVAAVLYSCGGFLTEELRGEYDTATFFTNAANAERAVTGIYNNLLFTSQNNYLWVFGDVASDDSVKGGNPGDVSDIDYIDDFSVQPDNGILNIYWTFSYEAVARANNAVAYIPDIDMDENLKQRFVAEAKFLRAFNYFHLVNIWGRIPLRIHPNTSNNGNLALSSVDDVYAQIFNDLDDAVSGGLPVSYPASEAGRVTVGAAYALRAKAHLFRQQWSACLDDIAAIEALDVYELADDYAELFRPGAEDNPEVIFAARHLSNQNPGLGNILNVYFAPSVENGYYFNAPTQSFVDCFSELTADGMTDPRLDVSIGRPGQPWVNDDIFEASWSPTGYLVKKYEQPLSEVPIGRKNDGYLPYIYLRYADVLLMKAEALASRNADDDLPHALDALNAVRQRAGLPAAGFDDQEALLTAVRIERRRELGFESHRFFDLMRWGRQIAVDALGADLAAVWIGDRFYFPLPSAETDANADIQSVYSLSNIIL